MNIRIEKLLQNPLLSEERDLIRKLEKSLTIFLSQKNINYDNQANLIQQSLQNITNFDTSTLVTIADQNLFTKDCHHVFHAIHTFCNFMNNCQNEKAKIIEQKLFNLAFSPTETGARVYSVYRMHDQFLTTKSRFCNFKSSTGSGKTRCAPFFFAMKALLENMERPYFIMTQPGSSIIKDKIDDFKNVLGNSIILVNDVRELIKLMHEKPKKPVVALFSPSSALRFIAQCSREKIDYVKTTRFCLDEIHERSVDTDVLVSKLAKKMSIRSNHCHLQLLMMSATPDPRVLKIFGNVEMFELPDSLLFPIEDIPVMVEKVNDIDSTAVSHALKIIEKMANNAFSPGHILIFTSGNARINNLIASLKSKIEKVIEKNDSSKKIRLLQNLEIFLTDKKLFYEKLDEKLESLEDDENTLYIMPIKFAGFLSQETKDIAKDPIPNHSNVVKIIVATNSIESSITIDGLGAVVDCGICNIPEFDQEKGLTMLNEGPISTLSQIQRRGRVGRIRNGICVSITIKNQPPRELLPPQILTTDISSNVLELRRIGIKLETIDNLPDPISQEKLDEIMNELIQISALDSESKKLTPIGRKMSMFTSMSPFLASSILKVSEKYRNDNKKYSYSCFLGSLALFIINTNNLVTDPMTAKLMQNFNEDSDIVTIMRTFLDILIIKCNRKKLCEEYGFHAKSFNQIVSNMSQIINNFNLEDEKETETWKNINNFFNKLSNYGELLKYIQSIIETIGSIKNEWISCRRAKYFTVNSILSKEVFVFNGDASLKIDNKKNSMIEIRNRRPGGVGFSVPGSCFILQITQNLTQKKNYGYLLHRDLSNDENIPHPVSIIEDSFLNNVFTIPLIEAYIGEEGNYLPFQKTLFNAGQNTGNIFCYTTVYGNKTAFSYVPKDNESNELMKNAIKVAKELIPFTPRTIVVRNSTINCVIAVTSMGTDQYQTDIINMNENSYHPYQLTKTSIEYLCRSKSILNSSSNDITLAITGESYIYNINGDNDELKEVSIPSANPKSTCIFRNKASYCSYLFILSKSKLDGRYKELSWINSKIHCSYANEDLLIHSANTIFRGTVQMNHFDDVYFFTNNNSRLEIKGNLPQLSNDLTQDNSNYYRPVGKMFDRFAMHCIQNTSLMKDVELTSFSFDGYFSDSQAKHKQELYEELTRLKSINFNNISKSERGQIIQRKNQIYQEMQALKESSNHEAIPHLRKIGPGCFSTKLKTHDNINSIYHNLSSRYSQVQQEKIPLIATKVFHLKKSQQSTEEFTELIKGVCKRFGGVISKEPIYVEDSSSHIYRGHVKFEFYTVEFSLPIAGEIENALLGQITSVMRIPDSIIPVCIQMEESIIKIIQKWLKENNFNNIELKGKKWSGPQIETSRAISELYQRQKEIKIPFKVFIIPGGVDIDVIFNEVLKEKKKGGSKWRCDKVTRKLIVPHSVEDHTVHEFIKKCSSKRKKSNNEAIIDIAEDDEIDPILGDYINFCEENAVLSGHQINIYKNDGNVIIRNFCVTCIYNSLMYNVGTLYDEEKERPIIRRLLENMEKIEFPSLAPCQEKLVEDKNNIKMSQFWPEIPLGQLMHAFVSEPVLNSVSRTWFTGIVIQALHSSNLITYCPAHPSVVWYHPGPHVRNKCISIGCQIFLCQYCSKWHLPNQCQIKTDLPPGYRYCPGCKTMILKIEACNHITCYCGKHFCYYCGAGPWDESSPVYSHLSEMHGGCFNNPPDYRKFYLNESVNDNELMEFYEKYPQFRRNQS